MRSITVIACVLKTDNSLCNKMVWGRYNVVFFYFISRSQALTGTRVFVIQIAVTMYLPLSCLTPVWALSQVRKSILMLRSVSRPYVSVINPRSTRTQNNPPGTRCCCDVESTSMTLIQRRNNVVLPVGKFSIRPTCSQVVKLCSSSG